MISTVLQRGGYLVARAADREEADVLVDPLSAAALVASMDGPDGEPAGSGPASLGVTAPALG